MASNPFFESELFNELNDALKQEVLEKYAGATKKTLI